MYKVIIVDDEMLARVGLKSLFKWEEEGFCIVGEADNGEKALSLIREKKPDIVITDYRMPVMDGIELLTRCKDEGLSSKFIILSAFSDFEYVRSTLKNGAIDYLLKLELEPDALLQALHKAAEQVRQPDFANRTRLDDGVSGSNIRHAYRQLINGCSAPNAKSCYELLERSQSPTKSIALLAFHILSSSKKALTSAQFGDAVGAIRDVIDDIARSYAPSVTLSLHRDGILCTVITCKSDQECAALAADIAMRVRETVKYLFNFTAFCGCSFVKASLQQIRSAWSEASDCMHYAELYDEDVCAAAAFQPNVGGSEILDEAFGGLNRAVETMSYPLLHETLRTVCQELLDRRTLTSRSLNGLCFLLVFHLFGLKRRMGLPEAEIADSVRPLQSKARTIFGHETAIAFIKEIDFEFKCCMAGEEEYPYIARAKAYVEAHLAQDISLDEVAAHVSLSPNYFSKLFHKRTGQKLTAYITDQKVNAAKARLLAGHMSINEVAESLGFENTTYFSKVFKKLTGCSPQQYQQRLQTTDSSNDN